MQSDLDTLGEQIAEDVAHLDAAHHRVLTKIRVFDAGGGWFKQGFRTCAQWLSWRVGWTPNTARDHVRVAKALGSLPAIDHALSRGELSYSKVRAITRVATPDNEHVLLEQARLTTGHQLETICRKYAWVRRHDADAKPADEQFRRYLTRHDTEDGMVVIKAVLHPDEAAVVWAALERVATERCRESSATSNRGDLAPSTSAEAQHAAAVSSFAEAPPRDIDPSNTSAEAASIATAEMPPHDIDASDTSAEAPPRDIDASTSVEAPRSASLAAHGSVAGFDVEPSSSAGIPRTRPSFDRAEALVHMAQAVIRGDAPHRSPTEITISIPLEGLQDGSDGDPTSVACCGGDGTFLSVQAARRLACDAGIIAMLEDEAGAAIAVGRKRRTIPGAMKRAMSRRDHGTCRFPGCRARAFLEGHHMTHWVDGGKTELANLLSLCSYHHRFMHEHGFTIELGADNTVTAYDASGRAVHEQAPSPAPRLHDLGWQNIERRNAHLGITHDTITCWDGTPADYPELIDWIIRTDERASRSANGPHE